MDPGTNVVVKVLVTEGVGMDRHEQALETYTEGQVVGIHVGFLGATFRF